MNRRQGYTLIELLVTVVLAILLLSLSVSAFHNWGRSSSQELAETVLRCELRRARAHALARLCVTRARVESGDRDSFISLERQDMEKRDEWIPISISNRIEMTHATPISIYFRTDGSCTTDPALIDAAASFEEYTILFTSQDGKAPLRQIRVDAHTGLLATGYVSESDDNGGDDENDGE